MKTLTHYSCLCLIFLLVYITTIAAQGLYYNASETTDTNNVRATINSNGILFSKFDFNQNGQVNDILPGFEVPKDSGINAVLGAAMWIGGIDDGGALHMAASTYRQIGDDFFPGAIDLSGVAGDTGVWDHLWKVGKTEIEYHKNHYQDAGYEIPSQIANWPGNGPSGFDPIMAPFADLNNNSIYEPALGDYPSIYGDQAVYFIFNDIALPHTESEGNALGIEVHGMAYEFSEYTNPLLANSVFLNYTIKNKSVNNYHDVYIGLWNDYDLGCFTDDYLGTDVAKNSIFVINADSFDGPNCIYEYGVDPPALATTFLSHPMSHSMGYYNDFSQLGNPYNSSMIGVPNYFYNYLQSIWKDGSHLAVDSLHSNGYGGSDTVDYFYPGFSDSTAAGQPLNWWWGSDPTPADMRIIGSIGPLDLPSQGVLSVDLGYILQLHNGGDQNGDGRIALSNAIQSIIDLYNNGGILSNQGAEKPIMEVNVYPNPFHDFTTIRLDGDARIETLELRDLTGKLMSSKKTANNSEFIIRRNNLPAGIYMVRLLSKQESYVARIVIQ